MKNKAGDNFLSALCDQIDSYALLSTGDRVLAAVSGGPDSMALLYGLIELRESKSLKVECLHVAHLDHGLRGAQSTSDAEFVRAEAQKLGLEVTIGKANVAQAARQVGESIETEARRQRYEFLERTAREQNCNKIALGHNADDNAETVLQRIIRGTGVRGLAGIPAKRKLDRTKQDDDIELIRPLLNIRRSVIEAYLEEKGIAFCQDYTNLESEHTRNRIRNELIPQLTRQYNPNIVAALLQLAQTASWLGEILSEDTEGALAEIIISTDENGIKLDAGKLACKSRLEQAEIVHQVLLELKVPLRNIGFKQIGSILELLKSDQAKVQLPDGWAVNKEGETIIFQLKAQQNNQIESPDLGSVILMVPGVTVLGPGWLWLDGSQPRQIEQIEAQWFEGGWEDFNNFRSRKTPAREMIDLDKIEGRLILRQRQEGDRFTPLGAAGEKKLGDFFTDAKVPQDVRDKIGLICDYRGIIWVMGMRIAEKVKIANSTKRILKLKVG